LEKSIIVREINLQAKAVRMLDDGADRRLCDAAAGQLDADALAGLELSVRHAAECSTRVSCGMTLRSR